MKKFWITVDCGEYNLRNSNNYKTLDSAIVAAKQRTAADRSGDAFGVFELVQVTVPTVPDIKINPVTE
jgi:hypothetical protein